MRTIARYVAALALLVAASVDARPSLLCTVGDSLVAGGPVLSGNPNWTGLLQTARIGQKFGAVNGGVGGYTVAQAKTLYESDYKNKGCTHIVIMVGTNNLSAGDSAATVLAALESLVASAQEDTSGNPAGADVTITTVPPRGGSASWDATKEARRLSLNTSILALTGVTPVDLEGMAGTGDPVEMAAAYRYTDLLHYNGTVTTGGSEKVKQLIDAVVSW
jgi:hypothetical protein